MIKNQIHSDLLMNTDLRDYCAEGALANEEMVHISENVSLRMITFNPPERNNNPAVIFIPGWISMIDGWKDVLLEMSKDFKIYYLETREKISSQISGHSKFSVEEIGNDIVELVKILRLENQKYILLGSSLGATAILNCCKDLTVDPKCLVLIGPNAEFRMPKSNIPMIKLFYPPLYNFFKPYIKWYLRNFRLDIKNDYEQYEKYCMVLDSADPWKLKKAALSVYKYSVWSLLYKINYPALILGAEMDKLHEPENLKMIVSQIKKSTFIDLKSNKGTHSSKVVEEIRKYLTSTILSFPTALS